ncbi:hypothetical protein GOV09_00765 [Candidatus Woesearchaeota archaeon]|nr:hypothetical protein [Candidatus Woesearchaeota archaeon]
MVEKSLIEWALYYFKSKDAFQKKIVSIKKHFPYLDIQYKDKKETIICCPELDQCEIKDYTIITLNRRKNVEFLHDNWKRLSSLPELKIYFINPFSTSEKRWIIHPFTHNKICDEESLKTGLLAMFETVEPITLELFKKRQYRAMEE